MLFVVVVVGNKGHFCLGIVNMYVGMNLGAISQKILPVAELLLEKKVFFSKLRLIGL